MLAILLLTCSQLAASPDTPRSIRVAVGMGLDGADDTSGDASGVQGQVEYIWDWWQWLGARGYAGVHATEAQKASCGEGVTPCDVSSQIAFGGAKLRVLAPIPYVGPFFELGAGVSVGNISARAGDKANGHMSGITYHIPVTIGLAFGENHSFATELSFLFHPQAHETAGAVAIGFTFPLGEQMHPWNVD